MSRPRLQRDQIVQHALELADTEGLDAVSFRRLAADLGVTPMALYRYVADRDDLLGAMSDLVLAEIEVPGQAGDDWVHVLREVLRSSVTAYTRHPAARHLSYLGRWSPGSLMLTQRLVALLTGAGFTEREALVIIQRLSDAALGDAWSMPTQPSADVPSLDAGPQPPTDHPRMFGIEVVLAGTRALAQERAAASSRLWPRSNTETSSSHQPLTPKSDTPATPARDTASLTVNAGFPAEGGAAARPSGEGATCSGSGLGG